MTKAIAAVLGLLLISAVPDAAGAADAPLDLKWAQLMPPAETVKPKPKYLPDWRRDRSKGFLPGWLILFAVLLGTEWALRRMWGMV